jgi:hypothetical protein
MATSATIDGVQLRARIEALSLTVNEAAERLGLTPFGLFKQMSGQRKVSRQTELLIGYIEREAERERRLRPITGVVERSELLPPRTVTVPIQPSPVLQAAQRLARRDRPPGGTGGAG